MYRQEVPIRLYLNARLVLNRFSLFLVQNQNRLQSLPDQRKFELQRATQSLLPRPVVALLLFLLSVLPLSSFRSSRKLKV